MVLVIGFLLLVSLVLSAVLAAVSTLFSSLIPSYVIVGQLLNFMISFSVITLLFAAIYKFLPDVRAPWKDLWVGAIVTALLFNMGKFLIGLYLGNSGVTSAYGAAGSLVVILLWVFYSAQIILFGAEFTQVYAKYRGSNIQPSKHAVRVVKPMAEGTEMPVTTNPDTETQATPKEKRRSNYGSYALTLLGSIVTLGWFRRQPRSRRRPK
jgi:membrane protein